MVRLGSENGAFNIPQVSRLNKESSRYSQGLSTFMS